MADLTICKYGCSSLDGCSGQCECICPCDVPACPNCGRAWTHYRESEGKRTYTDARIVARYEALYGENPFKAVA